MFANFSWADAIGGSFTFMVLAGCSVLTLAVALERAWYFWKRGASPRRAMTEIMRRVRDGQTGEAKYLAGNCLHPFGAVAVTVLESSRAPDSSVEERLQVTLSEQKLLLERNLVILGTMAATAPLIGLLGTVWGIMRAFGDMAAIGSAAPTVVAAGIAEALITTAAGLIVAVPAVVLYNHFSRRMNVLLIQAENQGRMLRDVLAAANATRPQVSAETRPARQAIPIRHDEASREPELTTIR